MKISFARSKRLTPSPLPNVRQEASLFGCIALHIVALYVVAIFAIYVMVNVQTP